MTNWAKAVAVSALIMAALPVGVGAQGAGQDVPEGVISPGPFGLPYAEWAEDWHAVWGPFVDATDCTVGDHGEVFYVPWSPFARCTVTSDQHLLVMVASSDCRYHPAGKERRDQERRSDMYGCLMSGPIPLTDPFLAVDGEPVSIDERFFVLSPIDEEAVEQGSPVRTRRSWIVMLEPLSVGTHRVETGITADPDGVSRPLRRTVTIEVVSPA